MSKRACQFARELPRRGTTMVPLQEFMIRPEFVTAGKEALDCERACVSIIRVDQYREARSLQEIPLRATGRKAKKRLAGPQVIEGLRCEAVIFATWHFHGRAEQYVDFTLKPKHVGDAAAPLKVAALADFQRPRHLVEP